MEPVGRCLLGDIIVYFEVVSFGETCCIASDRLKNIQLVDFTPVYGCRDASFKMLVELFGLQITGTST